MSRCHPESCALGISSRVCLLFCLILILAKNELQLKAPYESLPFWIRPNDKQTRDEMPSAQEQDSYFALFRTFVRNHGLIILSAKY